MRSRQAEASQSRRPRSTSSTNSYWSSGRRRRSTSFSSGELTVIVHTVCLPALASVAKPAASTAASRKMLTETVEYRKCSDIATAPPAGDAAMRAR